MAEHNLENQLRAALQGLQPSREFVQTVEKRFHRTAPPIELQRPWQARRFVAVAGSVLAGFLLTLTLARLFYYLFGLSRRQTA